MSGQRKLKQTKSTRKRATKRERMMTDKESSDLLESASQALAMVQGSKLVGGRISVRQAPAQPRARDKKDIVELRERLNFSQVEQQGSGLTLLTFRLTTSLFNAALNATPGSHASLRQRSLGNEVNRVQSLSRDC